MKTKIIFVISLFVTAFINAQIYTPTGTLSTSLNDNIGIGTNTPRSKLEIIDNIASLNIASAKHTEVMIDNEVIGSINFYKHYALANSASIRLLQAGNGSQYSQAHLAFCTTSDWNPYTCVPIERMRITSLGNVGIGTTTPNNKLDVNGTIHSQEVKVDMSGWPDFVFEKHYTGKSSLNPNYNLPTLASIEAYVKANHHLPQVPSGAEVAENGLKLGEMNGILLQKIEELTLYLIQQNKEIQELKATVKAISAKK